MSVEVKGLADVVRNVKQAISVASNAAAQMQNTAQSVVAKINQVNALHQELAAADADLAAAIGEMSNGGPPLEETPATTPPATPTQNISPAPAPVSAPAPVVGVGTPSPHVAAAKIQVETENAAVQNSVQATADKYIARP